MASISRRSSSRPGSRASAASSATSCVYAALGERMREEVHALSMKTLTPEECGRCTRWTSC